MPHSHQKQLIGDHATAKIMPAFDTVYHRDVSVRIAGDLCCPRCGRRMRASDLDRNDRCVALTCQGCHDDIMVIEAR
jgi:hypothetical protein